MTEKLYWSNMYLKDFGSMVVSANGKDIILDRTAFYPTGGGQPCDTGRITIDDRSYNIIDVKKAGNEVIHTSDSEINAKVGEKVYGVIDWDRRMAFMRHHTAIHVLDAVIEKGDRPAKFTGAMMYLDRAHFDVDMADLNRELAQQFIDKANKIVDEGHDVVARYISKEEAMKISDLSRTEPGRQLISTLDTIRVVEIVGIDTQADGGLHVKNTKDIGKIKLSGFDNKGSHRKRIEITLE